MGPMNRGKPEKAKNIKQTSIKLIKYGKRYLPFVIISIIFIIAATIFEILGPNQLKKMTNEIINGITGSIDFSSIKSIGITLIVFYSLYFILSLIQNLIMAEVTQRMGSNLRTDFSKKINILPLNYFDQTSSGEIMSKVTNDIDTIAQTLKQSLSTFIASIVLFFGSLIMMFYTNWILAFTAVGSTIFGFVLMMLIMINSQKFFSEQQRGLGKVDEEVEEAFANHNIVKSYNGSEFEKNKFNKINNELYKSAWKSQFLSGLMMPIMTFMGNFGYVAVCVVGAVLVSKGTITFGVIVAFMLYIRLFTNPLAQIAQALTSLQRTTAASERVFEFLELDEMDSEENKQELIQNVKGEVEFKDVVFGYTKDKTIIHDFSAHIKSGQKIAIVGPTGAGKTTMVNLLMRFYEINSGKILIDGIDTSKTTRHNVHDQFCMVLQDTWLYEGTILDNIVYSKKGVSKDEVVKACKSIGLHHFIMTLPDGYETVLNDKATISEGQKQLITIARAMIKDSPLLILDEATSNVDTRTEILIQEAMDKLMKGRTSFIIAHRLSTIKNADLILVMQHGDIIEKGNHNDLMNLNGFYADLYNSQFEL